MSLRHGRGGKIIMNKNALLEVKNLHVNVGEKEILHGVDLRTCLHKINVV